jgi:hypothetical protein
MVRGRLVIKSLLPLRPRPPAPQYQSRLLHQSLQIPSHLPRLALAQTAFPVRAKQVHVHRKWALLYFASISHRMLIDYPVCQKVEEA